MNVIRGKLKYKLKNSRQRHPELFPGQQKVKGGKQQLAKVGLPYYRVVPPESGEDAQAAYKLKNQANLSDVEIQSLKTKTFPMRRHLLTASNESIKDIKRRFPWMFTEDEVWDEFERVCGVPRRESARRSLERIFREVGIKYCTSDDDETLRAITDSLRVAATDTGAITLEGGCVAVDGEKIGEARTAVDGVLLWVIAHTVFATNVPKCAAALLHFIQRTCLGVKEHQTALCRSLGTKLAKLIGLM